MLIYKKNILKYKYDDIVIRNMLLASIIHDTEYKTNYHDELVTWLKSKGVKSQWI